MKSILYPQKSKHTTTKYDNFLYIIKHTLAVQHTASQVYNAKSNNVLMADFFS